MSEIGRSDRPFIESIIDDPLVTSLEKVLPGYLMKTVQINPVKAYAVAGLMAVDIVAYARSCNQSNLIPDVGKRLSINAPSEQEKIWLAGIVDELHGAIAMKDYGRELWQFLLERVLGLPPEQ